MAKKKQGTQPEAALRLMPNMVPKPLWRLNAHRLAPKHLWNQIRAETSNSQSGACAKCLIDSPALECNEIWRYELDSSTATLTGFEGLCTHCHMVIHLGRSEIKGLLDKAMKQLCLVNGIEPLQADEIRKEARRLWKRRNGVQWTVRVDPVLLAQCPALKALKWNSAESFDQSLQKGLFE